MSIASTPQPPYYAVIFTSTKKEESEVYSAMANRMVELASQQPGFLGIESARQAVGITVSYWESLDCIKQWKQNSEHLTAQTMGKTQFYDHYTVRICLVQHEYHL